MSEPHRIRLHGPWETSGPQIRTIDWRELSRLFPAAEVIVISRRFGTSSGVAAAERVELVLTGIAGLQAIRLNGSALPCGDTKAAELRMTVQSVLQPRNVLELEIAIATAWNPAAEVRLEIF